MPVVGYGYTDLIPYTDPVVNNFGVDDPNLISERPDVWDYPFANLAALGIATFGMKKSWEYYYALVGQFAYWLQGFKGFDGMLDAIVGIQFGRGEFKFAMFGTLLSGLETINSLSRTKTLTYKSSTRLIIYAIGYLMGWMNK